MVHRLIPTGYTPIDSCPNHYARRIANRWFYACPEADRHELAPRLAEALPDAREKDDPVDPWSWSMYELFPRALRAAGYTEHAAAIDANNAHPAMHPARSAIMADSPVYLDALESVRRQVDEEQPEANLDAIEVAIADAVDYAVPFNEFEPKAAWAARLATLTVWQGAAAADIALAAVPASRFASDDVIRIRAVAAAHLEQHEPWRALRDDAHAMTLDLLRRLAPSVGSRE